jgi:hypothetical protein
LPVEEGKNMTKKFFYLPMLLLIALSLMGPVTARAEGLIEASLTTQSGELTVGDPILLTLSVTHPQDYQVIPVELEPSWGDFLLQSQAPASSVSNPDGTTTTTQVIDVRLFSPGTFSTPPLTITLSDENGQLTEVVAPPVDVTIVSVLIEGDSELRDIKPQADLPYQNLLPWIIGGALVLALAAGLFLWWRHRRTNQALAAVDNRLPHEVALDELARIGKMDLPRFQRFKEHYTLVSDSVRVYMERTYQIPVLERTTSEIKESFKKKQVSADISRRVVIFLDECDLVKFSKFTPDEDSAYQILADARQIVEDTKPILPEIGEHLGTDQKNVPNGSDFSAGKPNKKMEMSA